MSDKSKKNIFFSSQDDGQEDNVYLNIAKSKENWRRIAFIICLYAFLATGALIWQSFQPNIKPYLVRVNSLGQTVEFGPAESLNQTDERLIRAHLYQWLQRIRSIKGSTAFLKSQMNKAFAYLSDDVAKQLNQYFSVSGNDPRRLIEKYRRTVTIQSIVPINQKKGRWKLNWIETLYPKGTQQAIRQQQWVAYITIQLNAPETTANILKNPLGIYITSLQWQPITPQITAN